MELVLGFSAFLIVEFIGLLVVNTLDQRKNYLQKFSLSYGIGIVGITTQMMLYSFIKIPWNIWFLLFPWLLLGLATRRKQYDFFINLKLRKSFWSLTEKILLCTILAILFFVLIETFIHPLTAFDGFANYFMIGKAYFLEGKINPSLLIYTDYSYPPLLNLMIAFIYIILGGVQDHIALFFFSAFYIFLLLSFYTSVRKFLPRVFSLLFTLFLASTENIIRHAGRFDVGHADLPLGYFFFITMILLLETVKTKSIKLLLLLQLSLIGSILTKSEGTSFFLIIPAILVFYFVQWKKLSYFIYSLFTWLIPIIWFTFSIVNHLPKNHFLQPALHIGRIPVVVFYMLKEFLNVQRWNLLWIFFFYSLLRMSSKSKPFLPLTILFSQLVVYFGIYLMTPLNVVEHITSSFDRLLLHLASIALFCIAILFTPYLKSPIWITIDHRSKKIWEQLVQSSWPKTKKKI